jgi:hypothetical protein
VQAEALEVLNWQAHQMLEGMSQQLLEMFPADGDPGLIVTGFVFRPADDDDLDDEEEPDPEEHMYCFSAHFNAASHPYVGNVSTTLLVNYSDCETYEEAVQRLVREIEAKRGE